MKTIVVSDVHLGSDICLAELFLSFLNKIHKDKEIDKLVICGDLLETVNVRLKKKHWAILSKLRKLSNNIEVIWIKGNHCIDTEYIAHIIGIEQTEYHICDKILYIHGDMFYKYISKHPIITHIADFIYNLLQKIDKSHFLAKFAKKNSKRFLHCVEEIKKGAIIFAKTKNCNKVICGHSHYAEESDPYYNSGCWTEFPPTYLEIENKEIKLIRFEE